MGNVELWLMLLGKAMLSLLMQPFFYISLMILVLIYSSIVRMERSMFNTKLRPWIKPFIHTAAGGCLAAIFVSILCVLLGFSLTTDTIWWLWGITLLLSLINLRFVNIAHSAAIVTLLHLISTLIGPLELQSDIAALYASLLEINPVSLLIIASLLLLVQSGLIAWQGKHLVSPLYMSGKRGKLIGGYRIRGYWSLPLLLLMPVTADTEGAIMFAAQAIKPYFLADGSAWLLLACPIMLGVTGMTQSKSPQQLVNRTAKQWAIYAIILFAISIGSWWVQPLIWVAAIGMLIVFELLHWLNLHDESKQPPLYAPLNRGLSVLAVIEQSPATHMHIEVGDTILEANGQEVNTLAELYEAMSINPAFCKLKLLNSAGEVKFAQRTRYADEHHQLGIILAPDYNARHLKQYREPALISLFAHKKIHRTASVSNDTEHKSITL